MEVTGEDKTTKSTMYLEDRIEDLRRNDLGLLGFIDAWSVSGVSTRSVFRKGARWAGRAVGGGGGGGGKVGIFVPFHSRGGSPNKNKKNGMVLGDI